MSELEDDIVTLLISKGVATALNTDIFVSSKSKLPDGNGPYISIVASGGAPALRTHNAVTTAAYPRPNAQIVVRASTSALAKSTARAAHSALIVRNTTIGTTWYVEIDPLQEPTDFGLDVKGRSCFAFNVRSTKRP